MLLHFFVLCIFLVEIEIFAILISNAYRPDAKSRKQNPRFSTRVFEDHPGKPQWRMLFYNEMSRLDEPSQFLMQIRERPIILTDKKSDTIRSTLQVSHESP